VEGQVRICPDAEVPQTRLAAMRRYPNSLPPGKLPVAVFSARAMPVATNQFASTYTSSQFVSGGSFGIVLRRNFSHRSLLTFSRNHVKGLSTSEG